MTHDEKIALVGEAQREAAAARIGKTMQELAVVSSQSRRSLPMLAGYGLRYAIQDLEAVERLLLRAARADQDGVPTESLNCGFCGEHESRCQCAETCNVCGVRDCDDLHETDAAGYEPRARA